MLCFRNEMRRLLDLCLDIHISPHYCRKGTVKTAASRRPTSFGYTQEEVQDEAR